MNILLASKDKYAFVAGGLLCILCAVGVLFFQQIYLAAIPFALLLGIVIMRDIRIAFFLLMLSIPVSFNLEEKLGIGVDFPDEPLMLILTLAFVFVLILNYQTIKFREWLKNPLIILIMLSFLWMCITVVFSATPAFSAKYLVKRIWYLIPFLFFALLLFQHQKNIGLSFRYMFWPLLLIILLVLYRYSAVGFRFEEVHDPIQPFFLNHVMYGSMISCFVPLIAGALFLKKRFTFSWLVLLSALGIFLIAVYFSYSRAAWVAVIFAALAFIFIRFKIMHYAMLAFYTLVLSGVIYLSTNNTYLNYRPKFEKTIMHESLADHIMATLQGTDISSAERYYRWIAAVRMSVDHPILGVGPNNFYDYYKQYTITSYRTWVSRNPERSTTHNYFLFMLVEQGYPALILYAALIFMIFYHGQKVYHRQSSYFNRVAVMSSLCMIAALFINNFFSELLETDKIGSLFLLGIAVIVSVDLSSRKKTKLSAIDKKLSN